MGDAGKEAVNPEGGSETDAMQSLSIFIPRQSQLRERERERERESRCITETFTSGSK